MALEGFSIRELQSEITKSDAEWQASETVFTEMSGEERAQFLGFVPAPGEPTLAERKQMAQAKLNELLLSTASKTYPTSYDLRNVSGRNFITPEVDQGACGSCVAFGVAATVESRFRRQRNNPNLAIDFSEAHLFFCNNRQCKSGDPNYGWSSSAALNYFRDQGVVDEACYPYQGKNQACAPCSGAAGRLRKITGWKRITSHAEQKIL